MTLSLIVAVAENGVIGRDNQLPWRLPEDLRYFKRVTLGKPIVMGRKTFDSLGNPLPGRTNIVVTRDPGWRRDGVETVHSVDQALEIAARAAGGEEIMIIGGADIFAATLPLADRLYVTEVHRAYEGDVRFPKPDPLIWQETGRTDVGGDPDFSFVVLERRKS